MAPLRALLTIILALTTTHAFVCDPTDTPNDTDAAINGIPCPAEPVGGPLNPAVFEYRASEEAASAASTAHRTFEFELMRTALAAGHSSASSASSAASSAVVAEAIITPAVPTLKPRLITPLRPAAKTFRRPVPGHPVVIPSTLLQQAKPTETIMGLNLPTFVAVGEEMEKEKEKRELELEEEVENDGEVEIGNAETGYWKVDRREEEVEEDGEVEMGNAQTGYWKVDKRQESEYGGADEQGEFGNAKTGWWKTQADEWFD